MTITRTYTSFLATDLRLRRRRVNVNGLGRFQRLSLVDRMDQSQREIVLFSSLSALCLDESFRSCLFFHLASLSMLMSMSNSVAVEV